jgi:beta-ureidopropionase / N-carbamoyl-L-amino-acid hydrolase
VSFDGLFDDLAGIGRDKSSGGYNRFAWTSEDAELREWFVGQATARGLEVTTDRAGNQWAWWGDPDGSDAKGVVIGSHLDSVPGGGAFDGPLGVMSSFAALDLLREQGFSPQRPIAITNFVDEEGARFGVACAGSRIITGALPADRALALRDGDGVTMAEALQRTGRQPADLGTDPETLARVGVFVELHVEQGRLLAELDRPVAVGESIWPHGRWRLELKGEGNHAGTTRLVDRKDPMLDLAAAILTARTSAQATGCVATIGKVRVDPNGVNAIPAQVTAWLDARGGDPDLVRRLAAEVGAAANTDIIEESFADATLFNPVLAARLATLLGDAPVLPTGAGHDAGILAAASVPTAMLFVRNPTGISHSPVEHAERDDCLAGVEALAATVRELAGSVAASDPA